MKKITIKIFVLISVFISIVLPLFPESGIYDRIGIIPEHGFHGAVPEENIDLFSGNLTLRFQDIRLPGPNGFDVVVWRVYNSKILRDRLPGSVWGSEYLTFLPVYSVFLTCYIYARSINVKGCFITFLNVVRQMTGGGSLPG